MPLDLQNARELFLHAVGNLPPERWEEYVALGCAGDAELKRQVSHLLQVHRDAGSFLESPAIATADAGDDRRRPVRPTAESQATTVEQPGTVIGPYKLLQPIGEGGMGTVYMAEQTQPVRRTVALKLIKAGMDSRQVLARFGAERQALALMDHPNIAKVFDAGTTDDGPTLLRHGAGQGHPDHQVLRRTPADDSRAARAGHPGLPGRAARPPEGDHPPRPQALQRPDRPLRRQAGAQGHRLRRGQGDRPAADRPDALHRVRGGRRHARVHEPRAGGAEPARHRHPQRHLQPGRAALRALDRLDPAGSQAAEAGGVPRDAAGDPRGGVAAAEHCGSRTTEELPSIAACRNIEPRKLSGLVRGELDWIVMKALEKDRNRRYETANGLAADLRRYLDDEPVQACPPTAAYRLSKFAKKYRVAMATACAFVAVLIAATVISVWQAVRANQARAEAVLAYAAETQQRREAQDQRDRAFKAEEDAKANLARARAAVDDYLTTISESRLLNSPLPGLQPLRKELLITALKYYEDFVQRHQDDTGPASRPGRGHSSRRRDHRPDRLEGRGPEGIPDGVEHVRVARRSGLLALEPVLPGRPRSLPRQDGNDPVRAGPVGRVTADRSNDPSRSWISSMRDRPGDPATRADSALAHHYLSLALLNRGSPEEAIRHQRAAIELRKGLAEEFPTRLSYRIDLALSFSNLGFIHMRGGQLAEAFDSVRRANAIQRTLVVEHPEDPKLRHTLALSTQGMASILNTLGRWKESRPLFVESVEIMSRVVSENPAVTEFRRVLATSAAELGQCLIDHDEIDAGLIAFAKARDQAETVRRTNPNDVRNLNSLASIHRGIGKTHAKQGKTADALASLHEAIVLGERIAAEDNLFTYDLACGLALYGEVAGRDQSAPDKDSNKNSQHYSDKAMEVLAASRRPRMEAGRLDRARSGTRFAPLPPRFPGVDQDASPEARSCSGRPITTLAAVGRSRGLLDTKRKERLIPEAPRAEFKIPSTCPSSPCAGCLRISPDSRRMAGEFSPPARALSGSASAQRSVCALEKMAF